MQTSKWDIWFLPSINVMGIDLWIFYKKHEAPNMGPIPQDKKRNVAVCVRAPQLISAWRSFLGDMRCFHKKYGHLIQSTTNHGCKGGDGGVGRETRTRS